MKRLLLALGALVVLVGAGYVYRHELRLATLVLRGHTKVCSVSDAVRAVGQQKMQAANNDRIARTMRLVQKEANGFQQWDTPAGRFWMPQGSQYALSWDLAEQERDIYGQGGRPVRSGDVVLDCGANVGVFTRKALRAGARTVIAIELAPENIDCLRRNFPEEIRAGQVIVYPKGVWDKEDWLTLKVDPENSAADSVVMHPKNAIDGPRVPLTTIDRMVEELKLERVDFIKMDIEGAERRALRGAQKTIAQWHPRMALSAYHIADDPFVIPKQVHEVWSGYQMECGPCVDATTFIRPDVLYFF
jgi:FkbM family methyltransferase